MNIQQICNEAQRETAATAKFLRELIAIPSRTCHEGRAIEFAGDEMTHCGFDEVYVDAMGNLLGRIGSGTNIIAMDAHIDTVDIGNRNRWDFDPFKPFEKDGIIFGRGAADMKGAVAALIHAGKIIKKMSLEGDFTLFVTITVQEEDCEGLAWRYICAEDKIRPHIELICEPSNLHLVRGHRGRAEFEINVEGMACHGSTPDQGVNAIYKSIPIIQEISHLNTHLPEDPFLGKASITVTHIQSLAPSLNAVPDLLNLYIDRRIVPQESKQSVLNQISELESILTAKAMVKIPEYDADSYTGLHYPAEKYFPAWTLSIDNAFLSKAINLYKQLFRREAEVKKWDFSTNGIATAGIFGIPTIGFGPANPGLAHTVHDQCPVIHLTEALKFYSAFPRFCFN